MAAPYVNTPFEQQDPYLQTGTPPPYNQDPYRQNLAAYNKAQTDRCVRLICGIAITILVVALVIWLLTMLFRPTPRLVHRRVYVVPPGRPVPPPGYYHLLKEWLG